MKTIFSQTILAVVAVGAIATSARAQETIIPGQDNTGFGITSAEFLLLGAGARGTALGGSFAALVDDVTALYYNPAGAAFLTRPSVTFSQTNYIADTHYSWVGIAFPLAGGERVIGFQGGNFGFSDQPIFTVTNPDGDGSTYSVSESFFGLTYAQNFSDRFSAGLTAKLINDRLGDVSASGFALDLGTNFHANIADKTIRASFLIQNLGGQLRHDGTALDVAVTRNQPQTVGALPQDPSVARLLAKDFDLPTTFRVGLAYDVLSSASSRVTLLSEFTQPNNTNATASGALEWSLLNLGNSGFSLSARGSYTLQPDNDLDVTAGFATAAFATSVSSDENTDGIALGGGLGYNRGTFNLAVDYAYKDLGILGTANYFSATISW